MFFLFRRGTEYPCAVVPAYRLSAAVDMEAGRSCPERPAIHAKEKGARGAKLEHCITEIPLTIYSFQYCTLAPAFYIIFCIFVLNYFPVNKPNPLHKALCYYLR